MARRGQVFTLDVMLAIVAFAFLLMLYLSSWNAVVNAVSETDGNQKLEYAAFLASRNLFSAGNPPGWDQAAFNVSTQQVGILDRPGVLSARKLSALQNLNSTAYDDVRIALGAGQYQLFLNASGYYSFGIPPESNSSATARTVDRLMLLNGNPVKVTLTLWD